MNLSILTIREATADEWDNLWKDCDYATYFQSREWAEIWHIYSKGKICPSPQYIEFSDGKSVLLPLSYQKKFLGLVKGYLMSPAGTFGGWISSESITFEYAHLLANYCKNQLSNLVWRINPYEANASNIELNNCFKKDETHVINLGVGFDEIYKNWTKGHSSAARKARKEGVLIKQASTLEDWKSYYKVYQDSLMRWGEKASSKYDWRLFAEMFKLKSPNITLWLAMYREQVVSGALIFYSNKHVVYWHGAALKEYFHVKPVNLLMYKAIEDACEKGYSWFDFNPSGGHEGVQKFKKSFGTDSLPCPILKKDIRRSIFNFISC
ncbi:lipid II:glycine glycyltransferase FemX [Oscillatoria acuminata]|uniref:Putative methicillin resistance protein n=1 Tax=Oscillatoria acuminata PCC 6304 TaxID=56110 RepID=K9TFT3_9CYAN|nr:GNAT family N-acetyltransferase [Oscillatoria acuminata]AFY81405.1 putative methicillin resistance protein [Oscillatoria acuminata PCC 6304]